RPTVPDLAAGTAGGVVEDLRHARELFLQARLVGAGGVAPGGFDLTLALFPAVAGAFVGDARAQVVFHLAGLAAGTVGVAGQARGLQLHAAWLGVGVFAQVVLVVPGVALVQRRWGQAFGVGELVGRRGLRAFGFGRGGFVRRFEPGDVGDDGRRRFVAWDHHRRFDDLHFLLAAAGAGDAVLDGQRAELAGAAVAGVGPGLLGLHG